jgi:hypothetical protein
MRTAKPVRDYMDIGIDETTGQLTITPPQALRRARSKAAIEGTFSQIQLAPVPTKRATKPRSLQIDNGEEFISLGFGQS